MRVRSHIHPGAEQELGRPHLVEEDEGADHLPLGGRERPPYRKAAEVAGPGHDHGLDQIGGMGIAGGGIRARLPAHLSSPLSNAEATEARLALTDVVLVHPLLTTGMPSARPGRSWLHIARRSS